MFCLVMVQIYFGGWGRKWPPSQTSRDPLQCNMYPLPLCALCMCSITRNHQLVMFSPPTIRTRDNCAQITARSINYVLTDHFTCSHNIIRISVQAPGLRHFLAPVRTAARRRVIPPLRRCRSCQAANHGDGCPFPSHAHGSSNPHPPTCPGGVRGAGIKSYFLRGLTAITLPNHHTLKTTTPKSLRFLAHRWGATNSIATSTWL